MTEAIIKDKEYAALLDEGRNLDQRFATAVERERRARGRLRAQVAVLRTTSSQDDPREESDRRNADDRERARAIAAGSTIAVAVPPQLELSASLEEQRLLRGLICAANEKRAAVVSRLTWEVLERNSGRIREHQRRIKEFETAKQRENAALNDLFAQIYAAGYTAFMPGDATRRFAP